jgi:hypothetical protein
VSPQYVELPCPVVARRAKSEADSGTQLTFSDSSASEKQLLIFSVTEESYDTALLFVFKPERKDVFSIASAMVSLPIYRK